jgi:hypothetical protein
LSSPELVFAIGIEQRFGGKDYAAHSAGGKVIMNGGIALVKHFARWCAQAGEDLSPEELEQALRIIDEEQEWVCDRGFRALVETVRR